MSDLNKRLAIHPRLNTCLDHLKATDRILSRLLVDTMSNGVDRRWIRALESSLTALNETHRQIANLDTALKMDPPPAPLKDP